jgi:two-component system sensor histidine kinase UhpB
MPMSLQWRVLGSIALLLVLTLLCGGTYLVLHARSVVRIEVHTAFRGAERSVRDTVRSNVEHTVTLRQVVASFEGQRHVRAALVNEDGKMIVQSRISPLEAPAPRWFSALTTPPRLSANIPLNLPKFPCVLQIVSDPAIRIAEEWDDARNAFITMLLFCGATMIIVSAAFSHALRHLRRVQVGLLNVSKGHYHTRLELSGAPEFTALAQGFNHMAHQLESFSDSNQRLERQVAQVQAEERAGMARDLHDEVGSYLFAIQVDASKVMKAADAQMRAAGSAIRDAALHIQHHVRDILRQLRPANDLEFGLQAAIADLVAFWSQRYPAIRFEQQIAPALPLDRPGEDAIYRIVQESISNAVRHGHPNRIRITATEDATHVTVYIEDDGGGLAAADPSGMTLGHVGLAGMEERVRALKGEFAVEEIAEGVRIRAALPRLREKQSA